LHYFNKGIGAELNEVAEKDTGKAPNRRNSKYIDYDEYVKPRKVRFGAKVAPQCINKEHCQHKISLLKYFKEKAPEDGKSDQ